MSLPKIPSPIRTRFVGRTQQSLDTARTNLLRVGTDGLKCDRGWFPSSGTWVVEDRHTADETVVHLDRHGLVKGSFADAQIRLYAHPSGGCRVVGTGWIPLKVWGSNGVLFAFIIVSRLSRNGWANWMGDLIMILGLPGLFAGIWYWNLRRLTRDIREAIGVWD